MKKGLYVAFEFLYKPNLLDSREKSTNGIEKKIYYQYKTFEKYGYKMDFYNPYMYRKHAIERFLRRLPFHFLKKWNFNFRLALELDFIYIRKPWFMDGDLIFFMKKIKKMNPKLKIILEIPTYPYDSEGKGLSIFPLKIKDKYWRKWLHKYVDRIVTYSDDEEIFEVPTIKTSNAIDVESCARTGNCISKNEINMIACASLYYWHGYDRAIEGLYNYYKTNPHDNLNLYIVGNGAEYDLYKSMIYKYGLEKHVFLTGSKYGDELNKIYEMCTIGLDSMGRHRSGVVYNSSLKGKEYCAKGLIVVSGVKTELDNDSAYKYYIKIPADDTPVDFQSIIAYYKRLISECDILDIQKNIEKYAEIHFDFKVAMLKIKEFIDAAMV